MHHRDGQPSECALNALRALVRAGTYQKAGEAIHLSQHTVRWHLEQIRLLLGVSNLYEVVHEATLRGWITPIEATPEVPVCRVESESTTATEMHAAPAGTATWSDTGYDPLAPCPYVRPFDHTRLRSLLRDADHSQCVTYNYQG